MMNWKEHDFFFEKTSKILKNLRIGVVPAEIRTEHTSKKSLERYRYTNPLGQNTACGHFEEHFKIYNLCNRY
jgi:hypothetical protein